MQDYLAAGLDGTEPSGQRGENVGLTSGIGDEALGAYFRRSCETLDRAARDDEFLAAIHAIAPSITQAFRRGGKLLIAGNGESAADAQHFAGEFVSKLNIDRDPLPVIALTADTLVLATIGNDYGFIRAAERQVRGLGRSGDLVLAISISGRSPNSSPHSRPREKSE